ncbi:MAG: hypothetical protein OXG36_07350 [Caldilineaceae bacterium]|nr:hypothetical protein [Caldilineaceae bacterium]
MNYTARQNQEPLFTIPIGFRPREAETREVDGWPILDGVLDPAVLIPVRFKVQVAPTGEVQYLDGPELEEVGHLAYVIVTSWVTPDVQGRYDDQAAHHEGGYSLRRTGSLVAAHLRTTRSPVQHYARQAPEVLFTLPAGYRPSQEVQLEVNGLRSVNEAGAFQAELPEARSFRVQVAPNGEVRYVDDAGVDEIGYLAYEMEVSWYTDDPPLPQPPAAKTQASDLCSRHIAVQAGLRESLAQDGTWSCHTVTWADLARVEQLELAVSPGQPPLKVQDLAGLSGLSVLKLSIPYLKLDVTGQFSLQPTYYSIRRWPADLLTQVPNLRHLEVQWVRTQLPLTLFKSVPSSALARRDLENMVDEILSLDEEVYKSLAGRRRFTHNRFPHTWVAAFLSHAPLLTQLTLEGIPEVPVSETWLVHNRELRELTLHGLMSEMPKSTLRYQEKLEHLSVQSYRLFELPNQWLLHNQSLQTLRLQFGKATSYCSGYGYDPELRISLPVDLLSYSRHLQRLSLESDNHIIELPEGLLRNNSQLQTLDLKITSLDSVPKDLLQNSPELREARLHTCVQGWPVDFLAHNPQLQILHLRSDRLEALPSNFLGNNPQLRELSIDTGSQDVPDDLLRYTPILETANLRNFTQLPKEFLVGTPHLQKLQVSVRGTIPVDLLAPVSQLHSLGLIVESETMIPAKLLTHVPQLTHFGLDFVGGKLPAELLAYTPRLKSLRLSGWSDLEPLPANLFVHNPQLQSLDLQVRYLAVLPDDLLAHNPQLQSLKLENYELKALPTQFLAHNPQLQSLELYGSGLDSLPPNLLVHNPHLESLSIDADRLLYLPTNFLDRNPQLQSVSVDANRLLYLPANLFAHNSQLQTLSVSGRSLAALPADFLAQNLQLKYLSLGSEVLNTLPVNILASNLLLQKLSFTLPRVGAIPPQLRQISCLQTLFLSMHNVKALDPGILSDVPCLQGLYIRTGPFFELPHDFLLNAPQLRHLHLNDSAVDVPTDLLAVAPHLMEFLRRPFSYTDRDPR